MRENTTSNNEDWKEREHLIALIEKFLSPDAHVEHNVRLPVLGRTRTRQCDVVIRYGKSPRDSLAIVEVQKRNKRPDITTFHGWVEKMREVGAQQLICVSAKGYPSSIVEEVAIRIGPTVKLLTLEDIENGKGISGFTLVPFLIETAPKFTVTKIGDLQLLTSLNIEGVSIKLTPDEKLFSIGLTQSAYASKKPPGFFNSQLDV